MNGTKIILWSLATIVGGQVTQATAGFGWENLYARQWVYSDAVAYSMAVHREDIGLDTESPSLTAEQMGELCVDFSAIHTTEVAGWFSTQNETARLGLPTAVQSLCEGLARE